MDDKKCKLCQRDISGDGAWFRRRNGSHYICLTCWGKANRGEIKLQQIVAGKPLYGHYCPSIHGDEQYK